MNHLIHGDCIEYLRQLPDKSVTLLLTDPPYGHDAGVAEGRMGRGSYHTPKQWNKSIPAPEYFEEMLRVSKHQIIWGGNYFSHLLPRSRCWLVWHKKHNLPRNSFADCELAWTSFDRNALVYNCRWSGFVKDSNDGKLVHPTQKPLEVMKWCVREFSNVGETVLDPFLGSGTTAVAAAALARYYIGIEQDPEYFEIARARIDAA